MGRLSASILAAAVAAPGARAKVCDGSSGQAPCFTLPSGPQIPAVAMGSWSGSYEDCDKEDYACVQQHARFATENWLHIGGRHIDTANDYRTQAAIGEVLSRSSYSREDMYLTTKCPGAMGYAATIQCADDNLQMLGQFGAKGVQYLDLLLIHFPFVMKPECRFTRHSPACRPPNMPFVPVSKEALQETWRAMEDLKRFGVVKSIGVSDYNISHLEATLETAKEPIDLHQVEWNPKTHDEAMLDFCKKHGIQLQAWSPLGGAAGSVLSDPVVKGAAAAHGVSAAQAVLKWSIQRGVAVVVGTANAQHAKGDLDLFGFNLTDAEVSAISALGAPAQPIVV